jgi:hypothetical protein
MFQSDALTLGKQLAEAYGRQRPMIQSRSRLEPVLAGLARPRGDPCAGASSTNHALDRVQRCMMHLPARFRLCSVHPGSSTVQDVGKAIRPWRIVIGITLLSASVFLLHNDGKNPNNLPSEG